MPIYEYRCRQCGERFEKLVRNASEPSGLSCPSCGGADLALELSVFAAHRGSSKGNDAAPMCPAGGPCPTPGACGLN
ncbi:MAG: FmdB family zinc ribbon protein [Bryobacteraceae bacterium]